LTELKKKRRFEEDEAVSILREVLEGVEMLHRCSVIHRDLKPENICRHEVQNK
jgi:serine/threonine protein kinase